MVLQSLQGESKHRLIMRFNIIIVSFTVGIPKIYWYGEEAGYAILVMELLDRNIEEIYHKNHNRKFTSMTILLLID